MPKQTFTVSCLLFFIGALFTNVRAQSLADSSGSSVTAYNNTISKFYTTIGPQSRLYNGKEYVANYVAVKGNPFYNDATDWGIGSINYDGYLYQNVKIRYDLFKDEVVIPLYKSAIEISLLSDRVTSFDVYGHHFIYVKSTATIPGGVAPGFYDELYGGKIQVLARRGESIQQDHSLETIVSYFSPYVDYFVFKNNTYTSANSKGDFLDAMKDKKKEVQQFIRANKLKFNKDSKERSMARVAEYYDHLTE